MYSILPQPQLQQWLEENHAITQLSCVIVLTLLSYVRFITVIFLTRLLSVHSFHSSFQIHTHILHLLKKNHLKTHIYITFQITFTSFPCFLWQWLWIENAITFRHEDTLPSKWGLCNEFNYPITKLSPYYYGAVTPYYYGAVAVQLHHTIMVQLQCSYTILLWCSYRAEHEGIVLPATLLCGNFAFYR